MIAPLAESAMLRILVVPLGRTMKRSLALAALPSTIARVKASNDFRSPIISSTKERP